jgi:phosphate transport system substrate-binding protein
VDPSVEINYEGIGSGSGKKAITELFTQALDSFSSSWTAGSGSSVEWPVDQSGQGIGVKGNQGVAEAVTNTSNSLGYVELSYAISNRLTHAQLINRAGRKVIANAESLQSAINDFGIAAFDDNFTAIIVDGYGEGSWPISGYTYLILHRTSMTDCTKTQKLLAYVRWTLTDPYAGGRAAQRGYSVLPDAVRNRVLAQLDNVMCNGQPAMKIAPKEQ